VAKGGQFTIVGGWRRGWPSGQQLLAVAHCNRGVAPAGVANGLHSSACWRVAGYVVGSQVALGNRRWWTVSLPAAIPQETVAARGGG